MVYKETIRECAWAIWNDAAISLQHFTWMRCQSNDETKEHLCYKYADDMPGQFFNN